MKLELSKPQLAKIRDVIVDAYIGAGANALEEFDQSLGDYVDNRSVYNFVNVNARFPLQVGQLLAKAYGEGWLPSLLGAVLEARPEREDLQALLRSALSTVPAQLALDAANNSIAVSDTLRAELQEVLPGGALVRPETMDRRIRAVCRVDYADLHPPAVGTGFLVGPDLVLTNWHVMQRAIEVERNVQELRFRFDVRTDVDAADAAGRCAHAIGKPCAILKHRPPGGVELAGGKGEPTLEQLDYALIRLAEKIGDDQLPAGGAVARRGHIVLRRRTPEPPNQGALMVLQHPMRGPIQFAIGRALGPNETGSRLRHDAATQRGSSGAPVLGPDLDLMALHNGTLPGTERALQPFNTAVPIGLIVADLIAGGITEMLQD